MSSVALLPTATLSRGVISRPEADDDVLSCGGAGSGATTPRMRELMLAAASDTGGADGQQQQQRDAWDVLESQILADALQSQFILNSAERQIREIDTRIVGALNNHQHLKDIHQKLIAESDRIRGSTWPIRQPAVKRLPPSLFKARSERVRSPSDAQHASEPLSPVTPGRNTPTEHLVLAGSAAEGGFRSIAADAPDTPGSVRRSPSPFPFLDSPYAESSTGGDSVGVSSDSALKSGFRARFDRTTDSSGMLLLEDVSEPPSVSGSFNFDEDPDEDIEELERLLRQATRPRVRAALERSIADLRRLSSVASPPTAAESAELLHPSRPDTFSIEIGANHVGATLVWTAPLSPSPRDPKESDPQAIAIDLAVMQWVSAAPTLAKAHSDPILYGYQSDPTSVTGYAPIPGVGPNTRPGKKPSEADPPVL